MISVDDDMMMGTEVRTGFEVVQLPLSAQRACALRRIIIAEKAGNNPTHTASLSHQYSSAAAHSRESRGSR